MLVFAILGILLSADARASGGVEAHGGPAVVCRALDGTNRILSAEMLDLFEARNVRGLRVSVDRPGSAEEIAAQVFSRLQRYAYGARYRKELAEILERKIILEPEVRNTPTNDVFPILSREGCKIEQVAVYVRDERRVLIDREIFDALDATNQAALYVHEAVYKIDRDLTFTRSAVEARRLTGYLLADEHRALEIAPLIRRFGIVKTPLAGVYVQESSSGLGGRGCMMGVSELPTGDGFRVLLNENPIFRCADELRACSGNYVLGDADRWVHQSPGSACRIGFQTASSMGLYFDFEFPVGELSNRLVRMMWVR